MEEFSKEDYLAAILRGLAVVTIVDGKVCKKQPGYESWREQQIKRKEFREYLNKRLK